MRLTSTGRKRVTVVILVATAFVCFGLGAVVGVSWTKDEVVPVVLVKPHIGGFVPIERTSIGNNWSKNAVKPVTLVKPGIGGFVPIEGSSIGNSWPKDEVTPVMLVEPSIGSFVPLKLIVSDAGAVAPSDLNPLLPDAMPDEAAEIERKLAETVAKVAPAGDGPSLIEARIDGTFEGWDGETIFKLDNGQIWQQVSYAYTYHYAFRPAVLIIKTGGAYKMKVDGVERTIFVKRVDPEVILYDRAGDPVAWIDRADEMIIYLWTGRPVAYLSGKSVYGFNGEHLGWYADGSMYDGKGNIVAISNEALARKATVAPARGVKGIKPVKAIKRLAPLEPLHRLSWSDLPSNVFLLRGVK